ncbi:MAG TPA: glycosyltransferase [Levilinea sp.]|nr:glycosyltransferase [Levilinea sp.]
MHILLVADGRSPNARRWMQGILTLHHRVTLVSTYPCQPLEGIEALHVLPVAFASHAGSQVRLAGAGAPGRVKKLARALLGNLRYVLGPPALPFYARRLSKLAAQIQPDVAHALRIPFEGMLATAAQLTLPLAVTIWGNDLTLHASRSRLMHNWTLRALRRANGLIADTQRDIRLAQSWGFQKERAWAVLPGGGGVDLVEMHRLVAEQNQAPVLDLPEGAVVIINPRGFRPGSVRNDIFFEAIPLVVQRNPNIIFLCTGMLGQPEAENWVRRLKIEKHVRLLPYLPQADLWRLFKMAHISASISAHDGTPNSLLEAMAMGCFPVAGDIESLREWITPGVNGLLVDPSVPQSTAEALLLAAGSAELRERAAAANLERLAVRAEVNLVRTQMEVFYQRLAG